MKNFSPVDADKQVQSQYMRRPSLVYSKLGESFLLYLCYEFIAKKFMK